mgnify:CR=1 FL=1
MGNEEDKPGSEHLKQGKKHLEKGTHKVLREGIEKGRRKTEYYSDNRSDLIKNLSSRIGGSKEPAVSGVIVLLPIFVVILIVNWLFRKIAQIPGNQYINLTNYYYINQSYKLALLLVIGAIVVTGVGRLVKTERGFRVEKAIDTFFGKIPFIGSIYDLTKVSTETLLGYGEDLSRPVKVDFNGMRLTAFKTGNRAEDGRAIVFIPTAPNITSGMVVEIEEERVIETEENSEEALTRIFSAGFGQNLNSKKGKEKEES